MIAFHGKQEIKPADVIQSCLLEGLITANKDGAVFSNRWGKHLGSMSARGYRVCSLRFRGISERFEIAKMLWQREDKIWKRMIKDDADKLSPPPAGGE